MSILQMILAAIVLLGPLVAIHEFGHFWVARRFGIKVLVYSIGFGPVLFKRLGKDGVQYQLAAIPLGGYVKMADEREGEVDEADVPRAFNRQSPWVRMAVVAAGPAINLLFAIFLYWILFLPASEQLNTRIGMVEPQSIAAQSGLQIGDRIVAIDGTSTPDWESLNFALVERMGESGTLTVTAERNQQSQQFVLPVQHYMQGSGNQDPLAQLGFYPWQPNLQPVIGDVSPDGAGAQQGLKAGDQIVAINQTPVSDWVSMTRLVKQAPNQALQMTIRRDGQTKVLTITPAAKRDAMGKAVGLLGIGVEQPKTPIEAPADYRQTIQYDPLTALGKATVKTWELSAMTVQAFGKMLTGLIGLDNISGPITIAKVAGHTADLGWQAFISFMALMSVSLGILNLMPIPVLDGGHLVYYFIEAIRGRPVSEQVQMMGLRIGMAMLGMLMFLALFNDFSRLI